MYCGPIFSWPQHKQSFLFSLTPSKRETLNSCTRLAMASHRSAYAGFAHRRNGAITPSKRVFANGYYTSETGIRILFAFASAILFERATLKRNPQTGHCQRVAVRDEYKTDSKNRTNNIEQRQNSRVFSACYAGLINHTNRIVGTHRIGGR